MPSFPFLTLLISGGHTLLLLANSSTQFRILATTADESIGRAYDKVGRLLELNWGNTGLGAALEAFCVETDEEADKDLQNDVVPKWTLAMRGKLAFSYSGLHSAVERYVATHDIESLSTSRRRALGRRFQEAAIGQLEEKVDLALKLLDGEGVEVKHLVVSGGVASNQLLRDR